MYGGEGSQGGSNCVLTRNVGGLTVQGGEAGVVMVTVEGVVAV
jgi:hypothetical protein